MGKNAKAVIQKGKILSFLPTGEYYFKKGLKAYHRRDYKKAQKYLERAFQLEPGEPMIACQLAIILTELGEYENSNQQLNYILEELDEEMVECHYFLANNYAHMGFFKEAYLHAMLYMEQDPEGDFAEDNEELIELLEMESSDLDDELYEQDDLIIKQEQARELLETGDFQKAIELLQTVVKQYPEYWSAYNNLALGHFYLGEVKKAENILKNVLERNPGNLHALCNQLVFAYYLKQQKKVAKQTEMLKKIVPVLSEQQYKLGATFALVGEYELAYGLLKKVYKQGFQGDGPFYYWLSYSAYFTGNENFSRAIWKKVLEFNREKEGFEPWNSSLDNPASGLEDQSSSIVHRLESDYMEERLFALYLISLSEKKDELLASVPTNKLTAPERQYYSYLSTGEVSSIVDAHEIANYMHLSYQPIGTVEAGLYLLWFSVCVELLADHKNLKNKQAWAAAIEYIWNHLRSEKETQQEIACRHGISSATVGKYVKMVNRYLL